MNGHDPTSKSKLLQSENEQEAIRKYIDLQALCFKNKKGSIHTREAFTLTTQLLSINPELYTVWNYRRLLLPSYSDLSTELTWLTKEILPLSPKSYWVWNHRLWCLQSEVLGPSNWVAELKLVEQVLILDPRNFHAWNYRRKALLYITSTDEYSYTFNMISHGITNASAWHHRSTYPIQDLDQEIILVRKAVYTEPEDPPAWLYYRWLFSQPELVENIAKQQEEMNIIEELREMEPECKWVLGFLVYLYTRPIHGSKYSDKAHAYVAELKKLDPYRQEYYASLVPS